MINFLTMSKSCVILSILFLSACSYKTHKVDLEVLEVVKNRKTMIGKIEVPCSIHYGDSDNDRNLTGTHTKENQLLFINKIEKSNILKVLKDVYGLNTNNNSNFNIMSETNDFTALLTETGGRCYSLENKNLNDKDNFVDISYYLDEVCTWLEYCTVSIRYYVSVNNDGDSFIKHRDEISSFTYIKIFDFTPKVKELTENADKIPAALKRDILAMKKPKK